MKKLLLLLLVLCLPLASALTLTDSLVRSFTFDNTYSNATYTISNVGDANATVVTAINGSSCLINQCYTYTGDGDHINLSRSVQLRQAKNFTISLWANRSSANSGMMMIQRANLTARDMWMWLGAGDSNPGDKWEGVGKLDGSNYGFLGNSTNDAPQNKWVHLALVLNETHMTFWVNGTAMRTVSFASGIPTTDIDTILGSTALGLGSNWTGQIDELYIWNRGLNQSEIAQLYNSGAGLGYPFVPANAFSLTTTLVSPANGATVSDTGANFTASYAIQNGNLTNATYYVWYSNSSLFNQTTVTVTGNVSNSTTLFIDDLSIGNYLWNVNACGVNITGSPFCSFASSNFSFSAAFSFGNTTYNATTYETALEGFTLSITTFPNILSATGRLVYNGTSYLATTNCTGTTCIFTRAIDIPLVNASMSEIKSFFWNVSQFDGSTQFSSLTTAETQNVSRIFLQICNGTVTTRALNFTAYDEQNRTRVNPFYFAGTFMYWLGGGSVVRNQSFQNLSAIEQTVCISPQTRTFKTDAQIDYNGAGSTNDTYNQRNYFFQNASLTNVTQHIKLFLLNQEDSTSFIQRVLSISQIPVEGALIFQQRYYPSDDTYETVAVSRTDNNGESIGFYEVEIPDYRHLITKQGELLKATDRGKIFPESSPFTLIFTIGEGFTNPWEEFEGLENLFSTLTFNETTSIVSYTWIDTTGGLSIANLTVIEVNPSGINEVVCTQTSILQAGTITCNMSGFEGGFTASGYIGRSPAVLDQLISFTINALKFALARQFLLPWILLLITCIAIALPFPPAGIPLLVGTLILGNVLGLVAIGWVFIWALIAVGIWVLIETTT